MDDRAKRIGVIAGFIVVFVVLIANAVIVRRDLRVQVGNHSWVTHTLQVELAISELDSHLKDAELAQLGYVSRPQGGSLKSYEDAKRSVTSDLDKLERLTADNPVQQRYIGEFRTLAQEGLTLAPASAQGGAAVDAQLRGMQALIPEMRAEEDRLSDIRLTAYDKSFHNTQGALLLTSAAAAAGLLLLLASTLGQFRSRERHARQLLEREEWFRITLTSLGDAVITTDEKGCVTYLNPLAEQLMGVVLADVLNHPIDEIFPIFNEATLKKVENPISKVLESGRIVGLANHTVLRRADGSMIPIEDSAAPIRDAADHILGVVLVFRDATNERKAQKLLRESEKLTSAARMSATVAHEINNPLEAVSNLLYLAKREHGVPAAAVNWLEGAERELNRVALIAKRTLGFYRESKVADAVDLPTLIRGTLELYSSRVKVKRLDVVMDLQPCPPVIGIEGELRQAVSNLIANAIDAAPEKGAVRISCTPDASRMQVLMVVQDDGPGIAPHLAERIFEPFFTTKKDVGTGLGLWITKEIVERHNGSIRLGHSPGDLGGAAFSIALPCSQ